MNQELKNNLLFNLLDHRFFQTFKQHDTDSHEWQSFGAELIVSPECNQACEYCYIHKYKDQLYPKEIRDHATILKNLKLVLNRFKEEDFVLKDLQLFSGEIWASDFGLKVIEEVYQASKEHIFTRFIIIPSNMSFLMNDSATEKIQEYIDKFKALGVQLHFSASIDGKILDEKTRPFKDKEKEHNDDFYNRVFKFCAKNYFSFHPMISSQSVKYWKENYLWFQDMLRQYNLNYQDPCNLYTLEVRDDTWTDESIQDYLKFLDFLIDYNLNEFFHGNLEEFTKFIFNTDRDIRKGTHSTIKLQQTQFNVGCTLVPNLFIRLGDLSIVPCHRTQYPEFIYGKFKDITTSLEVEANNVDLPIYIYDVMKNQSIPKCHDCPFNKFCHKTCLGASYEYTGDLLAVSPSTCKMYKAKYTFLLKRYNELGMINILFKQLDSLEATNQLKQELTRIYDLILR